MATEDDKKPTPPARPKRSKKRRLGPVKAAQGRRLYVIGECKTFREVAETLKVSASMVGTIAAEEGWRRLRIEHAEEISRRAIENNLRNQTQPIVRTTRLMWKAAEASATRLAARVISGELTPRPSEVESIIRSALALTGAPVADNRGHDDLDKLSLREIMEKTAAQIERGLGAK